MIKKKGGLSFKPKAPVRRAAGASLSRTTSARPSIEPSVETPPVTQPAESSPSPDTVPSPAVIEQTPEQQIEDTVTPQISLEVGPSLSVQDTHATTRSTISTDDPPTTTATALLVENVEGQYSSTRRPEQPETTIPTLSDEAPQVLHHGRNSEDLPEIEPRMYLDDTFASTDVVDSLYPPIPDSENTAVATTFGLAVVGVGQSNHRTPIAPGADLSALGAGQSNHGTQIIPVAPLNPDGTSGVPISHGGKPEKQPPKRRKRRIEDKESDIRATIEVQIQRPIRQPLKEPRPQRNSNDPPRKRKKRAETPEDAEEQVVDQSTLKMSDLCKDLGIGKRFSKAAEIKKRENEKRVKRKLAKLHPELYQHQDSTPAPEPETSAPSGPQMRIVDGQIVIDDASLVVDRHREAAAAAPEMEIVVEDEFSRVVTSGTHMKRETNLYWSTLETEKFYDGLRMFGTDFEMISKMFPGRTRRQVKLKFNKDEREYPKRINSALLGERVAINLEEYQSHTGLEYEEVSAIQEEQDAIEEEHEAERRRVEEAAAEATRQKKADIQSQASLPTRSAGSNTAPGTDSAKENEPEGGGMHAEGGRVAPSKGKKKGPAKRKKRNLHSTRGGGEEVEVLGTIDSVQP